MTNPHAQAASSPAGGAPIASALITAGPIRPLPFGHTPGGRAARLWTLANAHGMTASVTDLGGCLVSLRVPDGHGGLVDVVLGYGGAEGYGTNAPNLGAPVGRHANRIGAASFTLDGTRYQLAANERGNSLHSGPDLWLRRTWEVVSAEQRADSARIELALASPDGDQGFPGELAVRMTYELTAADELAITYEAHASARTVVNLTNHSYFNLNGHASGTVLDHTLRVDADGYTETRDDLVPTGRVLPVEGTPLDLRAPRALRAGVESDFVPIVGAGGYDHNFALRAGKPTAADEGFVGAFREVATLTADRTGISMDVLTDTPGIQVYTGNFVGGEVGKDGVTYRDHDAVCLETQFFPDAVNHENFEQPVFGPDRPYRSRTTYRFRHA